MKIILASFLASTMFLVYGNKLNGQQSIALLHEPKLSRNALTDKYSALRELDVNIRVVRRFITSNPAATNVRWNQLGNRYVVRFETGKVKQKIVYSKKGSEEYCVKMYGEESLSRRIRALVMSTYYDYEITSVQELRINSTIIYFVRLCGAESWKLVRISNDEFDEIESLLKS